MSTAIIPTDESALMEQVLLGGDLKHLSSAQKVAYYRKVCESLGLNPLTKPFDFITLNGKLTLYVKRDATDQLRKNHGVSVTIPSREQIGDAYVVTARAATPEGRTDESTGVVVTANLKGEALANAMMKAETKAKRRVTLSIVGLGWLDESETESIPNARPATVNTETGEVLDGAGDPTESSVQAGPSPSPPQGADAPPESRRSAIARLNRAFVGSGLGKDDLRDKARMMFGRPEIRSIEDLTNAEVAELADEVEALVQSTGAKP